MSVPKIIPIPDAFKQHIEYLLGNDHVTINGKIIHSLYMSKDDLQIIYDKGKDGGVRLYFCIDKKMIGMTRHEYVSVITVPLDVNGDNVLTNAGGSSVVANNFSPCPDMCPPNPFSKKDLNYYNDNGTDVWCKPNESQTEWVDEDGNEIDVEWPVV